VGKISLTHNSPLGIFNPPKSEFLSNICYDLCKFDGVAKK
jgi:hypothetical protein